VSLSPIGSAVKAAIGAAKPRRFWRGFARALDRLVVDRSKRAVPAAALRRSRQDIERCRRLLLCVAAAAVTNDSGAARRTAPAIPRR